MTGWSLVTFCLKMASHRSTREKKRKARARRARLRRGLSLELEFPQSEGLVWVLCDNTFKFASLPFTGRLNILAVPFSWLAQPK